MSLAKCKACGHEVSQKADKCPNCGDPLKRKSVGCGGAVGVVLALIFVGAVFNTTMNRPGSSTAYTPSASPAGATAAPPPPPAVPVPGSQWSYDQSEDEMAEGKISQAHVSSSNTVNFGFPYSGAQHGTLTLRSHPRYGKELIFQIKQGQILCNSYETCKVLARFDDNEAIGYEGVGAADNSTETVFIRNYSSFIEKMLKAKRVRVSVEIYQEGSPVFDFDVSDFDQAKYLPH